MNKRLMFLLALILLLPLSFLHAQGRELKLELNNEEVLKEGDVLNLGGTTYVDAQQIARLLGLDFFSFSGGQSVVLRTLRDDKEYFLYFYPSDSVNVTQLPLINRGGERSLDFDQKTVDYMTTEMYDRMEEEEARKQKAEKRMEILKKDYIKVVEEGSYISKNDRTFVPVKAVAKGLGLNLKWDGRSNSVLLYTKDEAGLPRRKSHRVAFTDEDLNLLAKVATVEAGGGSEYKLLAVCNVVLNRVESPRFPSTIREVIYQSGQFPPVYDETFKAMQPYKSAINAALRALYGENNVPRVLFFNMEPFESKDESELFKVIEGDYFYY